MQFNPHDYQQYAIEYIESHETAAVLLDMGLGKTAITLTALYDLLFDYFEITRILVIAPLRVARNTWPQEIEKWDHLKDIRYSVAVGTEKERLAAFQKDADIYIINRENVQWIREIAFDRWGAVQMVQNLEGMGFTVVPFGQGFKDMSPPTKELMKLVLEGCVAHGGHPVLRWMMDNIYIRTDPAGNIKPDKEKSTEKIDGAVATVMALDRAIRCGNDTSESVYDSRGLLFI